MKKNSDIVEINASSLLESYQNLINYNENKITIYESFIHTIGYIIFAISFIGQILDKNQYFIYLYFILLISLISMLIYLFYKIFNISRNKLTKLRKLQYEICLNKILGKTMSMDINYYYDNQPT